MNIDRRKLKRRHILYYLRTTDQETEELKGHVGDITAEGILLLNSSPIRVGQIYDLRIDLPSSIYGVSTIQCLAKCMWCKPDANPDLHGAGFKIVQIDEKFLRTINSLINILGFKE